MALPQGTDLTIARFELYPTINPTGYAVGFNVTCANGQSFYIDATVPLSATTGLTTDQIVQAAYNQMATNLEARAASVAALSPLLGSTFTPS